MLEKDIPEGMFAKALENREKHTYSCTTMEEITEALAKSENNAAMRLLGELLADKNNEPTMILAIVGGQMRKMYAARVAIDCGLTKDYVMKTLGLRYDFIANRLIAASRRFSTAQIKRAVELCAETDFAMKSSGADDEDLLKELLVKLAFDA